MYRTRYLVGLLTLAVAVFGAWFLWGLLQNPEDQPGLPIRVEFRDARGLRVGADVRYRGVTVGSVRSVAITEDGTKAFVDLLIESDAATQARVNSTFWVVSPRFSGLTTGATGLDTLVRDAYVAFLTPEEPGSVLRPGSLIGGAEGPPADLDPDVLQPLHHGDLLMSVLVPENHGLKPGSPVVFRGMVTGDVRSVKLAEDGSHVVVQVRVKRTYRNTVTDESVFWVAQPYVSGALFTGFTVSDVTALLSPFVSYYSEPDKGLPVEDGFRVAASATRPDLEIDEVPGQALRMPTTTKGTTNDPLVLVRVVYSAVEEDTWSANDLIRHEGTGVMYLDREDRVTVLTTRSTVDGNYTEQDSFGGDPDIVQEQIKVLLPSGPVLRAHRVWVAPDGTDLAVLVLEDAPPDLRVTEADLFDFGDVADDAVSGVRVAGEDGSAQAPVPLSWPGEVPEIANHMGGALVANGRLVGVFGWPEAFNESPALVRINALPEDLRPRR
ncbi:MAG: MlaD family protein [Planctomycetota bacterium]|nr:MlaD family protein [Planctomycetota bacterium]